MPTFTRRSLRSLLIPVALSAASCAEIGADTEASTDDALASENGFSYNGFSYNGFSYNGFSYNGFSYNGFSYNGFSYNGFSYNGLTTFDGVTVNGLESATPLATNSGYMTTAGGREIVKYMVKCAYPAGTSLTSHDQSGNTYTFAGAIGLAPELQYGTCGVACQEKISGCMLAHVNNAGVHVGIWLVSPDAAVGWGGSPDYPFQEGTYFGNMFTGGTMKGYYCAGKDVSNGAVLGRMGGAFGTNSTILSSPYGYFYDAVNNQNLPVYCASSSNTYCTAQNEGFASCADPTTSGHSWTHPVTVYRNFEANQLYKICNKANKCLGVVAGSKTSGANVEQRAYTGAAGQTWQIVAVAGGYKIVNKTSGLSLDMNGTQVVQRAYTGVPSQIVPLSYTTGEPGRANLRMASLLATAQLMPQNASTADGALVQAVNGYPTGPGTPDQGRWSFVPVSLATFDPGSTYRLVPQHAPTKSIEVMNGSTTNGTALQQYDSWSGDPQKLFIRDAGNGNVKLAMKVNLNKCIGPANNGTTAGTMLQVQDCNGSFNQSWITGETTAGSGIFVFKNAAAPTLCLDVAAGSASNGARVDMFVCNGAANQQFALQVAP